LIALHEEHAEHRAFLNRYYGASRLFYDATRKYYLLGRDGALRDLAADRRWSTLVEVGPGTGRNLLRLHRARPAARLGGLEASDAMIDHARRKCPWALLVQGFAEDAPLADVLGERPDRILFSYCLSMVGDRAAALANARAALKGGGEVVVIDFSDLRGLPRRAATAFRAYLGAFRVTPLDESDLRGASEIQHGPGRYFVRATFRA
jgi:S-adenosylmethionine-diacylgycerolhomoserine-N-methlytransferase